MPRFRLLLRQLRHSQELSQEELARALSVSRQSIISLERGEYLPSAPVLIALMEFFGCSLPELIEGVKIQQISQQPLPEPITEGDAPTYTPIAGALNIHETDSYYQIDVQLPGYSEQEVSLEMTENTLTITGEHTDEQTDEARTLVRREWQPAGFSRSVRFEIPIKDHQVEAKLENGVLIVIAPKAEHPEPKVTKIPVKKL